MNPKLLDILQRLPTMTDEEILAVEASLTPEEVEELKMMLSGGLPPNDPAMGAPFPPIDMGMGGMPPDPMMGMAPDLAPFENIFPQLETTPKPTSKQPSKSDILEWSNEAEQYWTKRNNRFKEDQDLYDRTDADYRKEDLMYGANIGIEHGVQGSRNIVLNDPYTIVNKIAQMIGGTPPSISAIPKDTTQKQVVQKVEDMLYWWRDAIERRWQSGLHSSLGIEEVWSLALRGWLCGRIMWNPDNTEFPFRYSIVDPFNVFPTYSSDNELLWVIHKYSDTKTAVLADLSFNDKFKRRLNEALKGKKHFEPVNVISYYDKEWRVIIVDDTEITDKKSAFHGYGFLPWIITTAAGSPFRTRLSATLTGGMTAQNNIQTSQSDKVGVSILEGMKEGYKEINYLASALATEVGKAANPPIIIYNKDGEPAEYQVDMGYGGVSIFSKDDEKAEILPPYPAAPYIQNLLSILMDRQNRVLPSVMFGEGIGTVSGFAYSILHGAAADTIYPFVRAMERYYQTLYEKVLQLYVQFGDSTKPLSIIVSNRATGARQQSILLYKDEVEQVGYQLAVKYRNLAPVDRIQLGNLAVGLVQNGIISRFDARGDEFLNLQNPLQVETKVDHELVHQNPDYVKLVAIPRAILEEDGLEAMNRYLQLVLGPPPGAMGPPAMGGPPQQGQGPPGNEELLSELPPNTLPPEMGSAAGMAPPSPDTERVLNENRILRR